MTRALMVLALAAVLGGAQQTPPDAKQATPVVLPPELLTAVERFFATQQAEDVDGYLALWSRTAKRPQADQLKYIFTTGDDKFTDLRIDYASVSDATARVRVTILRARTALNSPNPDGSPRVFRTVLKSALAFVKEEGEWKLVRESAPSEELAAALVAEQDPARRAAMLVDEADLADRSLVDTLGRRGDALLRLAPVPDYKGAQRTYERALEVARAIKDRVAEGRMLQNVANALYFQRDFPGALALYAQRLELERTAANEDGVASALTGIGTVRYSIGEYSSALTTYQEALAVQERLNDEPLIATTLLSIGNVLYLQGDFDGAIADYRRAEMLRRKNFDISGATTAVEGLARTYLAQGNLAAALLAQTAVLEQGRREQNATRQGTALLSIGDVHFRLGNLDAARAAFEESRRQFESRKDLANAGRVWQGTALTELVAARFPLAEAAYQKSHASCTAALPEPDAECAARALVGLAYAQAAQQKFDASIVSYRKSILAFGELKAVEAAARAQVGLAEALSGKEDYAASLLESGRARATGTALGKDDLLWRALVAQARAQRTLKQPAEALRSASEAVAAVQRMAANALKRPGEAVPRDTATAFVTAAVQHAEAGDAKTAFEIIEQMRAHALRVAIALNERDIAGGMSEEERAAEKTMDGEVESLFVRIDRTKSLPNPDAARIEKLEAELRVAGDKRNAWRQQLFARLPELKAWRGLAPPAAIDDVAGLLGADGQVLVEFAVDEHDLLILTAQRTAEGLALAAHVVPVERHQLAERIARAVDPAALGDVVTWRKASADLFDLLPDPLVAQLAAAPGVTIVPDDVLWRVPFEAMPVETRYLADRTLVRYLPSVTAFVRAPAAQPGAPLRLTIAAAPQLPSAVVETLRTTAPSWTLRPAPAAETEAARVVAALGDSPVTSLVGPAATEEALRKASAGATALHVAAPFRINAASPFFSAFLLAVADAPASTTPAAGEVPAPPVAAAPAPASAAAVTKKPEQDGVFEMREVPSAALGVRAALFSDPATMLMRDAAASMPLVQWVWRSGGVETLVLRRWGSDEAASADLLAAYYRMQKEGKPPAEAMRLAAEEARRSPALQPPSVWAGWLVFSAR